MIKVYTTEEVAEILKVKTDDILNLIYCGKIEFLKIGDMFRITQEHLEKFLRGDNNNINKKSLDDSKAKFSTKDVINIIINYLPKDKEYEVSRIHNFVKEKAEEMGLLSEADYLPNPSHIDSNYARWRHISQAALQRLRNDSDTGRYKYKLSVIYNDRKYTFSVINQN